MDIFKRRPYRCRSCRRRFYSYRTDPLPPEHGVGEDAPDVHIGEA
jgi:hypothetical protein